MTSFTTLLVYINNIIVLGLDATSNIVVKQFLESKFKLKDLGNLKYFFGRHGSC